MFFDQKNNFLGQKKMRNCPPSALWKNSAFWRAPLKALQVLRSLVDSALICPLSWQSTCRVWQGGAQPVHPAAAVFPTDANLQPLQLLPPSLNCHLGKIFPLLLNGFSVITVDWFCSVCNVHVFRCCPNWGDDLSYKGMNNVSWNWIGCYLFF